MRGLEVFCPGCSKRLPERVRFCAYCGGLIARQPKLNLAARLPVFARGLSRHSLLTAALGALLGGVGGGLFGAVLGDLTFGAAIGAAGVGTSAVLGEYLTLLISDRSGAERFGSLFGALGGASTAVGGVLIAVLIALWSREPGTVRGFAAVLAGGLYIGLFCGLAGAMVGMAAGALVGRYPAHAGWKLARRRGTTLGAALAWTLASVLGGLFAGDYAARITDWDRLDGAALGIVVQLVIGGLLLVPARRLVARWRMWWARGP